MSTNTRITRSKGKSNGLSLPTRTIQTRKQTIMENDRSTALNTTFNAHLNQHHQQTSAHTPQLPAQPPRPTSTQSATKPSTTDGHMG